jgi:23S rRNA pseudouridine1911/1915/1917 synthase
VNGTVVRSATTTLAAGDVVEIGTRVAPAAALPAGLRVVYEDADVIVVDKPAGLLTIATERERVRTLYAILTELARSRTPPGRVFIVHRLDRDTSGLLVVARSERAHRRLQRLLRDREIDRRYLTLVHGEAPPALTIDRTVGRDRKVRTRMAVGAADGREAVTHLRRLEDLGRFSLLEARLETGRTHQIRVHLESVGHPVVGDRVYGRRPETLGLERQFLHASRLAFPHPETGEPIEVESPLPDDLRRALALARRGAPAR